MSNLGLVFLLHEMTHAGVLGSALLVLVLLPLGESAGTFNFTTALSARFQGKLYPNDKYATMSMDYALDSNGSTVSGYDTYGGPARAKGLVNELKATRENVLCVPITITLYHGVFCLLSP